MTIKKSILAGVAALALTAGAASAATLTADDTLALGSVPGQNFIAQLTAAGATTLYSGDSSVLLTGDTKVTFSLVATESSFLNELRLDGDTIIEDGSTSTSGTDTVVNFLTDVLRGETFSAIFSAGNMLERLTFFTGVSGGSLTFGNVDHEFGIFANADDVAAGHITTFFLALDDDGNKSDDNHDDIIVRVQLEAVPLPAAGWMLLAGLGGIAAVKRRKKA